MPRVGLTPAKVVASAADLADKVGFEGVSLSALAESLGVRVPSLYKHIGGLDDLQARVGEEAAFALAEATTLACSGKRGRDALVAIATAYVDFGRSHPGRYLALRKAVDADGTAAFNALLVRLAEDFDLGGDDAKHAARVIRSALHGLTTLDADGAFDEAPGVDATLVLLVATLERGLGGNKGGRRFGPIKIG